jgi:RNA polymerase sigma-70 factor (ECF subfamily)
LALRITYHAGEKTGNNNKLSDEELILKYKKTKDVEIIGILFERYSHLVYGVCLKYLKHSARAEDASMEILEGLMQSLLNHDIKKFSAWLYRVSQNHCRMLLREKQTIITPDPFLLNNKEDFMESELEMHHDNKEWLLELLEAGLKQLNPKQEECLTLFFLENKSYQEVAKLTGLELKEIKSHIQNGKRNLKKYMIQNGKTIK